MNNGVSLKIHLRACLRESRLDEIKYKLMRKENTCIL